MGWLNNIFKKSENQSEEEQVINNEKTEGTYSRRINFSINLALGKYDEWYKTSHEIDEKYKGAIIVDYRNDEIPIILNYNNANKGDDLILLGIARFESKDGIVSQSSKELRMEIDRLISEQYNGSNAEKLRLSLESKFKCIRDRYNIEFTPEGEKILLNYEKKFLFIDKTVEVNETLEYVRIFEEEQEYNALLIPDEKYSYSGTITIVIPMKKYDLNKVKDKEQKDRIISIISQLSGLFQAANEIGIFDGNDIKNVPLYRNLLSQLQKTNYEKELGNINGVADIIKNMSDIRNYTIEYIMESSLYYEDVIEQFVNEPEKYVKCKNIEEIEILQGKIELLSMALKRGKEEFYDRMMRGKVLRNSNKISNSKQREFKQRIKYNSKSKKDLANNQNQSINKNSQYSSTKGITQSDDNGHGAK